jgi:hypothetical protein
MPGWYDDPFGMPQLRYWDGRTWSPYVAPRPLALAHPQRSAGPELDVAVRRMRAENSIAWGWRPVLLPIGAFVAVIVAGPIVTAVIDPKSFNGKVVFTVVANFVVYALLSVVVWFAGRDIAARHGGWGRTFGWRRPKWIDLGYAAAGFAVTLFARIVVGVVANAFTHGKASSEAQNLDLHSVTIAAVVLLVVITVVCAPVIEELVFRGLLLRTFMRRLGFWPAAVLSTLIFALARSLWP